MRQQLGLIVFKVVAAPSLSVRAIAYTLDNLTTDSEYVS